jgi:type IV pilus assembly protein PilY1
MIKLVKIITCIALFFALPAHLSLALDIELYVDTTDQRSGAKPKVLIIFDNSGSMSGSMTTKAAYDPGTTYPATGSDNSLSEKFIYFSKGTGIDDTIPVPSNNETRRFLTDINGCHTAKLKLDVIGFYTGHVREYAFSGQTGGWQEIPDNNGANIEVIDCWDDIRLTEDINAQFFHPNGTASNLPSGYPVDGAGDKQDPVYYTDSVADSNTNMGSGEVVTLYTDNYLRWHHSTTAATGTALSTKLAVAKTTINNLLSSAPSVDFGLELFNMNYPSEGFRDGGRIVSGIQEMNDVNRAALLSTIDGIQAETNTPLTEALFEAYRYLAGESVLFGNNDSDYANWYDGNVPSRDSSIETSGIYDTPYDPCSNEINVILITDGLPTQDHAADTSADQVSETFTAITALAGITAPFDFGSGTSYLPALSKWMKENDINSALDGDQTVNLYTVGFGEDAVTDAGSLLEAAATGLQANGTVGYFPAEDATALGSALRSALIGILNSTSTFSSPAIASNNFDRTRSLESIYYAMFLPDRGPRWRGNLKKLKLVGQTQVDSNGDAAIDADGNIKDSAQTFWSSVADGNEVNQGGVVEMFSTLDLTTRTLYSNIGTSGGFDIINIAKASTAASAEGDTAAQSLTALATHMGVLEADIQSTFDWSRGIDVDDDDNDDSIVDNRSDIFGDPLHSKPLVLNYGPVSSPDIRIVIGTNAGYLHMFDDNGDSITESWAFMPYELLPNMKLLRDNISTSDKVYGMDGSPMSYILDVNGDGLIDAAAGDKAWIFTGMRRGGSSYYAIDVSNPDSPVFLWQLSPSDVGMSQMGQSWSIPTLAYVKNNTLSDIPQPSLIIGAGYSTNKDGTSLITDPLGKGVYIIDAKTKTLIWSLTPAATAGKNTIFEGIVDGIPSSIKTMDSDFDGYIDRLYAVDLGGNVWRIDLPGSSPSSSSTPWTVFKLAQLGGADENDRRFFSAPAVARSFFSHVAETEITNVDGTTETIILRKEIPYDSILVGSGNRSHPNETAVSNMLFMIQDRNIISQSFTSTIPTVITIDNLYNITGNPFGQATTDNEWVSTEISLSAYLGWKYSLSGTGEKSLSSASVIGGVAYYTSFTPAAALTENQCVLQAGEGTLYALNMHFGTRVYDQIAYSLGDKIPDTPELFLGEDGEGNSELLLVGTDNCEGSSANCTAGVLALKPIPKDPTPCEQDDCPDDDDSTFGIKTFRNYIYVQEGAKGN